jgi:NADPH2:quinone reductase
MPIATKELHLDSRSRTELIRRNRRTYVVGDADPEMGDDEVPVTVRAEVVFETGPDLEAELREPFTDGVDACLDTIGLGDAGLVCVRDGGAFITSVPSAIPDAARGVYPNTIKVQPDGPSLAHLATLATEGDLTIRVAETLALEEFKQGYERLADGGVRGKILFTM